MSSTPTGELAFSGVEAPVRFGKYTLLTRLATGGMGEVYVAQMGGAAGFEKQVVIKRILPQLADDEQFVRMFLDEARLTAQLNHPNICQVFELGEIDGEYYIAMEYLEGLPLSRLVQKHAVGGIDLRVVAGIMVQACEGLAYAHDFRDPTRRIAGIVHRDVSPQNLFVTAPGLVKVLDFGVAKLYREGSQTVTVSTKGKHLYMSPEQVNGEPLDQRSDIFALATVMYEALTGQALFSRPTQFLTLQAIVTGDRPPVRDLRPDIPAAVESVLDRALALKPADRYPTARAMAEALTFAIAPVGNPASIIELAHFVQREHTDELTSERVRIQRASAHMQSVRPSQILPVRAAVDARARLQRRNVEEEAVEDEDIDEEYEDEEYEDEEHEDEDIDEEYEDDDGQGAQALGEPTVEAPPRLMPSTRSIAIVPMSSQHDVGEYFDLRPRWQRYLRWAVVAIVTLLAVSWFGRDLLGIDIKGMLLDLFGQGTSAPAGVVSEGAQGARSPGAAENPDDRPEGKRADEPTPAASGDQGGGGSAPAPAAENHAAVAAPATEATGTTPQPARTAPQPARTAPQPARTAPQPRVREVREMEPGYFTVNAQPYAEIYIDGKKVGLTPLVQHPLAAGRHRVRAVAVESGKSETFRILVSPKKTVTKQITFTGNE